MSKKTGANKNSSLRQQSTMDFIRSALGSTQREPGWEYGEILPVRARKNDKGEMEREWGLGYSNTAKGMMDALTLPRRALEGEEVTPEKAMEMAMNVTAPGVATARYAPNVLNMPMVYHGTPHRFPATEANPLGEFDASKIGAGEGAQMYGHGIYLAEAPGAAKTYKTAGSDAAYKRVTGGMDPMEEFAFDLATQGMTGEDLFSGMSQKYGKFLKSDEDFDRFDAAIKKAESAVGNLYTADLPDEMIDRMLDWDKPLSEQPENVQNVLREMWVKAKKSFSGIDEKANPIAGQIHYAYAQHRGGNASTVAEELRQKGIPGIKYLDQGSRDSGEGTRNFVIFPGEEKKVKILERK